jgi:hypothetical protein
MLIACLALINLPRRDPHNVDRVANHIGGALLAFRASGHHRLVDGLQSFGGGEPPPNPLTVNI